MKVALLALARQELDEAVAWYDEQKTGPEIESGVRRCLSARFPHGLLYGVDGDTLVVVAVAHLHREPRYWIGRD